MSDTADVVVVGGGAVGASAGAFLAAAGRSVLVLEGEDAPDRHSTGRSAALYSEYLGGPEVRALTKASGAWFTDPPPGFTDIALVTPRGMLALGEPDTEHLADLALAADPAARELDADAVVAAFPLVSRSTFTRAVLHPAMADLDVAALHQGMLRALRAEGGRLVCRAAVTGLARDGGAWRVSTTAGTFSAGAVVNAAGAWADEVAALAGAAPQHLVPRRRTACVTDLPALPDADTRGWPALTDLQGSFYIRPETGGLLVSPKDATPVPAGDVRPDELDVALGLERASRFLTAPLRRVRRAWAGLRTHADADVPLVGADPAVAGLYWSAGLGGHGIQTAPAVAAILTAAVTGTAPEPFAPLVAEWADRLTPARWTVGSG